jgi:hypothetical protein
MILFALAAIYFSPPGMIEASDARTIHSGSVDRHGWAISPDCAEWMKARRKRTRRATEMEAWVAGVITGYNLYHPAAADDALDLLEGRKLADGYKWIDQRCAHDSEAALPDVTLDLVAEWRER